MQSKTAVVIGGGPAGLMAAETLLLAGHRVELYEAMPSIGRKFLRAGKGGLNLTHAEPFEDFLERYGDRREFLRPFLESFGPLQLRQWAAELGIETFVGSSGRVFPQGMKTPPLLRAWRRRLTQQGLALYLRHRWVGWGEDDLVRFDTPQGEELVRWDALVLALGGGSWPQLGSDGSWIPFLEQRGVPLAVFKPANCGFDVAWSEHFRSRFEGQPVKPAQLHFASADGTSFRQSGEILITAHGIEGGPVYALSAPLRDQIAAHGSAVLLLDLAPDRTKAQLVERLSRPRGSRSLSSHLKRTVGFEGVRAGLIWEFVDRESMEDPLKLAALIKRLPVPLTRPRPLSEAISSAGGVKFDALDEALMLRRLPGVFCAGEMLDWEAPTGGYLLTACFSTGRAAGMNAAGWLQGDQL